MVERENIQFDANGTLCRGWFYRASDAMRPCIVMAHGFCGVKEMRLDAYAGRFADAGYHALVFDYRHFGDSEGEPRQVLDINKQLQDWRAAIRYARSLSMVAPEKIVAWGTSFSGGHVLPVAFEDSRIAAVISQVPHMNGLATAMSAGIIQNIRLGIAAARDNINNIFKRPPFYVPAFGNPGDLAAMTAKGEWAASRKLFPKDRAIDESVAARIFLKLSMYSPGRVASGIGVPLLVQVAEKDVTTPPKPAITAARKAPKGELITYDLGHFDVYVEPDFERTITDQLGFLKKHIG